MIILKIVYLILDLKHEVMETRQDIATVDIDVQMP